MNAIHHAALEGFGHESGTYERGRPDYPPALLGWLGEAVGLHAGSRAIDLGAGTGKFTRLLARTGARLTAIEPVDAMRARLADAAADVQALPGTAQAMPLGDACADAVICAQAFHWFADAAALREIHRVLRPAGRLGLVWNVRDESLDWVAATTRILTPYEGDAPRFHSGRWRQVFERQDLFTPPQRSVFAHRHVGSFDRVIVDRCLSVSFIAALPDDEKRAVEARLRALPETYPALRAPTIEFPYLTEAWLSDKRG